jgi:putative transposase
MSGGCGIWYRGHHVCVVGRSRAAVCAASHLGGDGIEHRRRFVRTTDSDHDRPIFTNSDRDIIPSRPNSVWVAGITHIRIEAGFCARAAVLDACGRKVVGCAISKQIDTPLALAALKAAAEHRKPPRGCLRHSDRGCQTASTGYRKSLKGYGLEGSTSAPANPYRNARPRAS